MMSEFDFKSGGKDNLFFGDLYKFLAEWSNTSVLTAEDYRQNIQNALVKLIDKHSSCHFAVYAVNCVNVLYNVKFPQAIATVVDDKSPWDDDETGEATINEKMAAEMKSNSMVGQQVKL